MAEFTAIRGRHMELDPAKRIGGGAMSNVYAVDEDTIVKVLKSGDMKDAEREILLSKWAFKQGIPTAISFDVVDVDGHPGLVYESLGRGNLRRLLREHPEDFDRTMDMYVQLLHKINSIEVEEGQLPKAIDRYYRCLEGIRELITPEEYEKMKALLDTIPDRRNVVHGDCQIKNVRVVKGEFFLIDLDTLSCGDAIFELSGLYCCYMAYSQLHDTDFDPFFEIETDTLYRTLDAVLERYFPRASALTREQNRHKIAALTYMFMIWCVKCDMPGDDRAARLMYENFQCNLAKVDDLILREE